jgi:hypothetical protein
MHDAKFLKHIAKPCLAKLVRLSLLLPLLAVVFSTATGFSQALSWATAERDTTTPMGGESQRPTRCGCRCLERLSLGRVP